MSDETLLKELQEVFDRTSLPLERRILDTAIWFHQNKDRIPQEDMKKRLEFVEKALDIFIEISCLLTKRVHQAEGRGKAPSLYLPRGVNMSGSVKEFG